MMHMLLAVSELERRRSERERGEVGKRVREQTHTHFSPPLFSLRLTGELSLLQ